MRQESLTRSFANGKSTTVETTLNTICDMAICAIGSEEIFSIHSIYGVSRAMKMNIPVPRRLKSRWMTAARFEFFFAPTVENSAVRQVPIF